MLFGHKKSENNNHTIKGNSVRNELRTGVILAEDINILIKQKCQYITDLTAQLHY